MKKIIATGLMMLMLGCTTPPNPPPTTTPVAAEPTKEELEAQLLEERRKLELAQFEEYVNKETIEMMEFFSVQVGQLVLFKPVSFMVSEDNKVGVAKCEVYVAGNPAGLAYVIAANDGTGWKFLTIVNQTNEEPPKETP